MFGGPADLIQVVVLAADPHAFLHGSGPGITALLQAKEDIFELVHPGVGEEQRRIVLGQERGTPNNLVPAAGEILEKGFPNVLSVHRSNPGGRSGGLFISRSMSSMAISWLDRMPWTRSLKLSGLVEYRIPCSKSMRFFS